MVERAVLVGRRDLSGVDQMPAGRVNERAEAAEATLHALVLLPSAPDSILLALAAEREDVVLERHADVFASSSSGSSARMTTSWVSVS